MKLTATLNKILGRQAGASRTDALPAGSHHADFDQTDFDYAALSRDEWLKPPPHSEGWERIWTLFSQLDLGLDPRTAAGYVPALDTDHVQSQITMTGSEILPDGGWLRYQYQNGELSYSYTVRQATGNSVTTGGSSFTISDPQRIFLRYLAQRRRRQELGLCERCGQPLSRRETAKRILHHSHCSVYQAVVDYAALVAQLSNAQTGVSGMPDSEITHG